MIGALTALVRLAALGGMAAVAADRMLAGQRGERDPEPIRSFVVIEAPIERVWDELVDVEGQPRWMTEMQAVRLLTPGPVGVGTRAEADIRIFGIELTDPVEVTEFAPPYRFAIRHAGAFQGSGVIELSRGADGRSTILTWDETLIPPVLPELGGLIQRPILGSIFQADLHRFRELLEEPTGPAPAEPPRLTAARAAEAEAEAEAASLAMEAEGSPPTPEEQAEAGLPAEPT